MLEYFLGDGVEYFLNNTGRELVVEGGTKLILRSVGAGARLDAQQASRLLRIRGAGSVLVLERIHLTGGLEEKVRHPTLRLCIAARRFLPRATTYCVHLTRTHRF